MRAKKLILVVTIFAIAGVSLAIFQEQQKPREATEIKQKTVLKIGTTNVVKVDNIIKDYYFSIFAAVLTHESLATIDERGNIVPHLVSWYTNDSRNWTLKLIANSTWHDGKPLTVEDIEFTIEYLKEKDPSYAVHFGFIESVDVIDSSTLLVRLNREWSMFPTVLLVPRLIPKHVWSKVDDPSTYSGPDRNIGSGPFIFESFDPASGKIRYIANKNYWKGSPSVDEVEITCFKTTDAMLMALKRGDIDITYAYAAGIDPMYVPALLKEKNISFIIMPNFGVDNSLWFNFQRYPYNITEFRIAISYALDYESYVNLITAGYGRVPTRGWIPDTWWYYSEKPKLARNISLATSILESIGFSDKDGDGWRDYPDGKPFKMGLLVRSDIPVNLRLAELVKRDLEDVKIRVEILPVDLSTFKTLVERTKDYDTLISRTTFWGMLTHAGAGTLYFDSRNMGWANVNDADYHKIVDEILRTHDQSQLKELYGKLQDLYAEKMYAIPLYWGEIIQPYRSDMIEGLIYDPMHGILNKKTLLSVKVKQ